MDAIQAWRDANPDKTVNNGYPNVGSDPTTSGMDLIQQLNRTHSNFPTLPVSTRMVPRSRRPWTRFLNFPRKPGRSAARLGIVGQRDAVQPHGRAGRHAGDYLGRAKWENWHQLRR